MSKKIAVFLVYFMLFLSFFQLKIIIFNPSEENLENLVYALVLGFVMAYCNGFEFFKLNKKDK